MAKTPWAQAASLLRKELKSAFPGEKFSVRSQVYSGGSAIDVDCSREITIEARKIAKKYQMGSFNGMEDIYEYTNYKEDLPQVTYVHVN